ncbi:MAG: hypothetical protein K8T89_26400 [Planctomycetes bacterium]|nr:hypothetical protein [Planctomycetota bacterium]
MPLKLNIGLNRKVGDANYGSHGASVNLELEVESALASDSGKLQERIRQVFQLVRSSLDEELGTHSGTEPTPAGNGNGHAPTPTPKPNGNGNGSNGHSAPRNGSAKPRPATTSQVRAIRAIAERLNIDLDKLLRDDYRVGKAEELSIGDASALIDSLKRSDQTSGSYT